MTDELPPSRPVSPASSAFPASSSEPNSSEPNSSEPSPSGLLASDAERDRAAHWVREAFAAGRVGPADLDARLTEVYAARTRGELQRAVRDLPEPGGRDALVVDDAPTSRFALGMFGGFEREGEWVAPPVFTAVSMFGGGRIDLGEARFAGHETRIRAFALWGGTEVVVPDDVEVVVKGFGLFGLFGKQARRRAPGRPRVVISGFALFGGVVTKTRRGGAR